MPIYEYHVKPGYDGCDYCNPNFEIMQKITARSLTECPKCSSPLEKLISKSRFKLKGGGWFKDGYSSKKKEEKD